MCKISRNSGKPEKVTVGRRVVVFIKNLRGIKQTRIELDSEAETSAANQTLSSTAAPMTS